MVVESRDLTASRAAAAGAEAAGAAADAAVPAGEEGTGHATSGSVRK